MPQTADPLCLSAIARSRVVCALRLGVCVLTSPFSKLCVYWTNSSPTHRVFTHTHTQWPVGVYPHRRRRSPPHARIVRAVDLPTRVCVSWANKGLNCVCASQQASIITTDSMGGVPRTDALWNKLACPREPTGSLSEAIYSPHTQRLTAGPASPRVRLAPTAQTVRVPTVH